MTAQKLDGKATAAAIKSELAERVAALRDQGVVPGLGTVLVGEDPASHQYVAGKHRDCAQVGIESIRVDLPADVTEEELAQKIRGLNANPHCTGYIVQLPLPRHIDTNWALNLIDPNKDAAGIGINGEGFATFTIAGPTGEGLTSARSFARRRRCVLDAH